MQVYRGLPVLTNQDAGARLVGIWPLDRQGTVGEYQRLAHEAIDEIVAAGSHGRRRRRLGPLVPGGADRRRAAADVPAAARARWERLYDRRGAAVAHAVLERRDAARGRARASERPQAGRPRARALAGGCDARPGASRGSGPRRRACRRSSSASTSRARTLARAHPRARRGDVRARGGGGGARCRRRRAAGARSRGRPDAAARARRSRSSCGPPQRFAAYQRKWMRRIPGIVMIDANRPAGEVADAILEVARAR